MRKFLAALMAVLMLTAALAVLPASAATATASEKDGSTAADAEALDLVVTEVLADTKSNNISMANKNAFQYIEVYNRGTTAVNLYDYAIVRATYDEKNKGTQWADPKKFDKKIILDSGSIYAPYAGMTGISGYDTSTLACINREGEDVLAPGETALIWIWNKDTKDVFGANGGTIATGENAGTMGAFRKHYKDMGVEIPADVKVIAAFGVDGIGQSCDLNVTKNYIYALVDDGPGSANTFDVSVEVAYSKSVGGDFTRNTKIKCMFKFGTSLGYYTTNENHGAVYTLASKTPYFTNAYLDNTDADYYASGAVDGYTEMACIYYDEPMNPGKLLPVQWADLDPARAPADVKGTDANWATTAWNTYVVITIITNFPTQEVIIGEWNYVIDALGKYYKIKTSANNVTAAAITQAEYDAAVLSVLCVTVGEWSYFISSDGRYYRYKAANGVLISLNEISMVMYNHALDSRTSTVVGEWAYFIGADGKYYSYNIASGDAATPVEITKTVYDKMLASRGAIVVEGWRYFATADGTYYKASGSDVEAAIEIARTEYDAALSKWAVANTPKEVVAVRSTLVGEWMYCIGSDGKYYKYQTAGGSFATAQEITVTEYDAALVPPAPQVVAVRATLAGEWMYCIGSDGKYYKYQAAGGSFATAQEITATEYDAALTPADTEDAPEGVSVLVCVLVAVIGALVGAGAGAGAVFAVTKAQQKKKEEK